MAKRVCSSCGKEKELEGGKICEKGHFICKQCVYKGSDLIFTYEKNKCPVCKSKLT
jgi:hypothetical protein